MLAALQEGLADEYALLDRWEEAEQARRAALALRRELGDTESVGKNLRILSRTLWRLCRGEESDRAAEEAAAVLEALPPGKELAWAYGRLAVIWLSQGRRDEAVFALLGKAQDLGELLHQADVVSYTLNAAGLARTENGQDGRPTIERALRVALDAGLSEAAGRAYSSLMQSCTTLQRHADGERWYAEGVAYCEGRELGVFSMCINGWRACALLLLGRWDEAVRICPDAGQPGHLAAQPSQPALRPGHDPGRRGEDGAWELLDRALGSAEAQANRRGSPRCGRCVRS